MMTGGAVDPPVTDRRAGDQIRHIAANYCPTGYRPEMGSLVIFSVDVARLAAFYTAVLGVTSEHDDWGGIRLIGDGVEIYVHPVPPEIAESIVIQSPPEPLEGAAIKPVFDVRSIDRAVDTALARGGVDMERAFSIDDLTMHDLLDPDGNVIQLRARRADPSVES
jgi:predicted enzyme related to lactoylglutathione lyase